ncbi:MAG: phosphotransferase [Pseudomonadota bacterium]
MCIIQTIVRLGLLRVIELTPDNTAKISELTQRHRWAASDIDSLTVAGAGNMNRTFRAQLSAGGTLILKQAVDHVAKYPQIPAPIERARVEADFYAAVSSQPAVADRMPKLLGYDETNRILCLGDLGGGGDLTSIYPHESGGRRAASAEVVRGLIDWLSLLHALPPPNAFPTNRGMRELNHEHIFDLPFAAATHEMVGTEFGPRTLRRAAAIASDTALKHAADALGEIYLGEAPHASQPALLHGDYYPGSWLEVDGAVFVLDPEFAFVGPAEFDVGVLIAHLCFAQLELDTIDDLLTHYRAPEQFSRALANRFAGVELIRRLLGVAQLPLPNDDDAKAAWLDIGRRLLSG